MASTHAPDGNSARKTGSKKEMTWGGSVFPETDPISLFFRFAYIPVVYIGMNTESHGGQQS